MYKILFSLLISGLLNAAVYDGVAIVVKDKAITLLDIKEKMQEVHADAKAASDILIRQKLEGIEREERQITVTSTEVFDDIKKTAQRNKLNISEFYEAVRNANGLSST
ncbi:MAG: peptidyl-prolyl cis-trans isomerase, partial [Sulfurimonas sp.]